MIYIIHNFVSDRTLALYDVIVPNVRSGRILIPCLCMNVVSLSMIGTGVDEDGEAFRVLEVFKEELNLRWERE